MKSTRRSQHHSAKGISKGSRGVSTKSRDYTRRKKEIFGSSSRPLPILYFRIISTAKGRWGEGEEEDGTKRGLFLCQHYQMRS